MFSDPIYLSTVWNTVIFLGVGINLSSSSPFRCCSGTASRVDALAQRDLPPALGGTVDPDDFLVPLDAELRMWGMLNNLSVSLFGIEGPWWLVKPDLAFGSVIFVHIWSTPFWTLILLAGRMAIPTDLYERRGSTAPRRCSSSGT